MVNSSKARSRSMATKLSPTGHQEGTPDGPEGCRSSGKSQITAHRQYPSAEVAFGSAASRRKYLLEKDILNKIRHREPPERRLRPGLAAPHFVTQCPVVNPSDTIIDRSDAPCRSERYPLLGGFE